MQLASTLPMTPLPPALAALSKALEARTRQLEEKRQKLVKAASTPRTRGRKPRSIDNPLLGFYRFYADQDGTRHGYPLWLDDVLQGIARLDWYRTTAPSIPLSVKSLVRILNQLEVISTATVSELLLLEERQARRYMAAVTLALPYLLKGAPPELMQYLQVEEEDEELFEDKDFDSYFGNDLQLAA